MLAFAGIWKALLPANRWKNQIHTANRRGIPCRLHASCLAIENSMKKRQLSQTVTLAKVQRSRKSPSGLTLKRRSRVSRKRLPGIRQRIFSMTHCKSGADAVPKINQLCQQVRSDSLPSITDLSHPCVRCGKATKVPWLLLVIQHRDGTVSVCKGCASCSATLRYSSESERTRICGELLYRESEVGLA